MRENLGKIRVLVVDDAVVMRRVVTEVLSADPDLEIVGSAANGKIALEKIPRLNPDVITLDINMPEMDGLEALRWIKRQYPHIRVIMFSTLTERGAEKTLDALALGASDYVTKPANTGSLPLSMKRLQEEMIPKIKQFFPLIAGGETASAEKKGSLPLPFYPRVDGRQVVAIGLSTGGPNALARMLPALPVDFPAPILIVQHMPPVFTGLLARRLNAQSRLEVREATQGEVLKPGVALVAPGDYHLTVRREGKQVATELHQGPPENFCRPAVDVLFASVAEAYGGEALGIIMTGMGQDGLRGVRRMKERAAFVIAQDKNSSVVWGMPGAVVEAGLADSVLPLDEIPLAIQRKTGPLHSAARPLGDRIPW